MELHRLINNNWIFLMYIQNNHNILLIKEETILNDFIQESDLEEDTSDELIQELYSSDIEEDIDLSNVEKILEKTEECSESEDLSLEPLISNLQKKGTSDTTIEQLLKSPQERSWQGNEKIDLLYHNDFSSQRSFIYDDKEGYREVPYGTKGSQRLDGARFTDNGIDIREMKTYKNVDSLIQNIKKQAEQRQKLFGTNLHDLTFVISPKCLDYTVKDAEKIYKACEEIGVNVELLYK